MNSVQFKVGNREYQLRLTSKTSVELERRLGSNPMQAVMVSETELPKLEIIIEILHASLQALNHSTSMNDTYDIYDSYIEDGGDLMQIMETLIKVFEVSGFFKQAAVDKKMKAIKK